MFFYNSVISINLSNIEELIFYDKGLQSKLPDLKSVFDHWAFAMRTPGLRSLGRRAVLDLLNNLTEDDLTIIGEHLGCKVSVDKLDYHIVKNYKFELEEAATDLNTIQAYHNCSVFRDKDHLYISCWR